MSRNVSRRTMIKTSSLAGIGTLASDSFCQAPSELPDTQGVDEESCLTAADDFFTVARGNPKPHTLKGEELIKAGMTPESWRLEIAVDESLDPPVVRRKATAEKQLTKKDGTALDYKALLELGKTKSVKLIKAIQCLNIDQPLGQGLWEGVPLRDVLKLCGRLKDVRRIYYWGFHNNSPKQLFQSSLSYTQAIDTAPGDPPVFLAYKLNGKPISPVRGGPVRMIVPWAYGFKSIKWLEKIVLSNDPRANDTYANQNNDPDSPMKTAAYIARNQRKSFDKGSPVRFAGSVVSGLSGLEKVQYLVRRVDPSQRRLPHDNPEILNGNWKKAEVSLAPKNWSSILPGGVKSNELFGFDSTTGLPKQWPVRYGVANWSVEIKELDPGDYEFRVRSVDQNGFAQPEPRPLLKSGRNGVPVIGFKIAK